MPDDAKGRVCGQQFVYGELHTVGRSSRALVFLLGTVVHFNLGTIESRIECNGMPHTDLGTVGGDHYNIANAIHDFNQRTVFRAVIPSSLVTRIKGLFAIFAFLAKGKNSFRAC